MKNKIELAKAVGEYHNRSEYTFAELRELYFE